MERRERVGHHDKQKWCLQKLGKKKTYLRTHEKSGLWQTAYLNSSGLDVLSGASQPFHQPSQEASETSGGQQGHCPAPGQIQNGLFSTVTIEIAHTSDLWLFLFSRNTMKRK